MPEKVRSIRHRIDEAGSDAHLRLNGNEDFHDGSVCLADALQLQLELESKKPVSPLGSALGPQVVSWQGEDIVLRPIRPDDDAAYSSFATRLRPEDLRLRFFNARREIPSAEQARMTHFDYRREIALVAVRGPPSNAEEILGVARAVIGANSLEAEFAIIVRSDVKHDGLGHLLIRRMISYLTDRGLERVVCDVLRENGDMLELAKSQGFVVDTAIYDPEVLRLTLDLTTMCP